MRSLLLIFLVALGFTARADDVVQESATGSINWSKGVVYAQGFGTSKEGMPAAQRRLLARRAAIVDGQRNLLEMTKGVRLTSMTKVVDMMVDSSVTATRVEGVIKGAAPVKESYQNEIYTVTMAMPIGGALLKAVYKEPGQMLTWDIEPRQNWRKQLMAQLEPGYMALEGMLIGGVNAAEPFIVESDDDARAAQKIIEWINAQQPSDVATGLQQALQQYNSGLFSGLLIDASGVSSFELATIPKIRAADGTVIYPSQQTSYDDIVDKRGVSYDFDLQDAISNQRVAKVPLVIKAQSIYESLTSDLLITQEDAKKILSSSSTQQAMNRAGVMIVVSI